MVSLVTFLSYNLETFYTTLVTMFLLTIIALWTQAIHTHTHTHERVRAHNFIYFCIYLDLPDVVYPRMCHIHNPYTY